jgi:hypothetical protein
MQRGYRYVLSASLGGDFDGRFNPELTPKQMLELGVFGGKYMTDCKDEFPEAWFARAKLSPGRRDPSLRFGARRAGFIPMIPAAGSSGTAAITLVAGCRRRTTGRSGGGAPCADTSRSSNRIAPRVTSFVARANARRSFNGPMTVGSSRHGSCMTGLFWYRNHTMLRGVVGIAPAQEE